MEKVISREKYLEICQLVQSALAQWYKADAKFFIERLQFLESEIDPPARNVYGELVVFTMAAVGQVKDKEFKVDNVDRALYKLERFVEPEEVSV